MIRTVDYNNTEALAIAWAFEYYCGLQEKLEGQNVKILSMFNSADSVPSMHIYHKHGGYRFHDYSSGKSGSIVDLVCNLYDINKEDAYKKILEDQVTLSSKCEDLKHLTRTLARKQESFKLKEYKVRAWNKIDAEFWLRFNISSKILGIFNVKPLESFSVERASESFTIKRQYLYGYFRKDGSLYKVYLPKSKKMKFFTVDNTYIQGSEQLEYKEDLLILASSLKDIMSLYSLGFKAEYVCPASENTPIRKQALKDFALSYKKMVTFFDNDNAGIIGMEKYETMYNIPSIRIHTQKDPAEMVDVRGVSYTLAELTPKIEEI